MYIVQATFQVWFYRCDNNYFIMKRRDEANTISIWLLWCDLVVCRKFSLRTHGCVCVFVCALPVEAGPSNHTQITRWPLTANHPTTTTYRQTALGLPPPPPISLRLCFPQTLNLLTRLICLPPISLSTIPRVFQYIVSKDQFRMAL